MPNEPDTVVVAPVGSDTEEGLHRRYLVSKTGQCPCGARVVWPSRAMRRKAARTGEILLATVVHEDGCPAVGGLPTAGIWWPAPGGAE